MKHPQLDALRRFLIDLVRRIDAAYARAVQHVAAALARHRPRTLAGIPLRPDGSLPPLGGADGSTDDPEKAARERAEQERAARETAERERAEAAAANDRRFTQADMDRVVEDRVARERRKYEGFDELKEKAARLDELEQANRSELERAQARAETAERQRDEARTAQTAAADAARKTARSAAIVAEAARQGSVDPTAVAQLMAADQVTVADDGAVAGAEDAVKALLEARPYLATPAEQRRGGAGPGGGGAFRGSSSADPEKAEPGASRMTAAMRANQT